MVMSDRADTHAATGNALGGRLPLLSPDSLTAAQRAVYDRVGATRVRHAEGAGYLAALPDGRLIGPFNAYLRAPKLAEALLTWVQAIAGAGIPADVREVVILTVLAHWPADYAGYAHTIAAARANLPGSAITALRTGDSPTGLRPEVELAHRLTVALLRDHRVPDDLYADTVTAFGVETLVTLVNLIGQYLTTAALLTCFQVPAPEPNQEKEN